MAYHPKNILTAGFMFLMGTFLTWWVATKISIFTSFFTNLFPQVIIWLSFIIMMITWIFILPYKNLTGAQNSLLDTPKTFVKGMKGLIISTLSLIIGGSLVNALGTAFGISGLAFIGWLIILGIIIKYGFIDVLVTNEIEETTL